MGEQEHEKQQVERVLGQLGELLITRMSAKAEHLKQLPGGVLERWWSAKAPPNALKPFNKLCWFVVRAAHRLGVKKGLLALWGSCGEDVLTAPGTRQAPTSAPERQRVLSLQAVDAAGRPQVVEYAAGQAELPVPMPEPTATLLKTRLESLGYRTHVYVPQGGIGSVISIRW